MSDDPWHIRAARQVEEWGEQRQQEFQRQDRDRPGLRGGYSRGRIHVSGWVGCAGLLGFCGGMFSGQDGGFGSMMMTGAIGAAIGVGIALGISFAWRGVLFLLALLALGIKNLLGGLTGMPAAGKPGTAFGAVSRSTIKGGFVGGIVGLGLALFLDEPVAEPMARVGAIGAGIAAFIRILSLARGNSETKV